LQRLRFEPVAAGGEAEMVSISANDLKKFGL
jgi:hypothetical protein